MSQVKERDTILVIEDDFDISEFICKRLQNIGKDFFCVHSASEAFVWLNDHSPKLILLDYMLPDSNAITVIDQLTQINKVFPIIVMTGMGDERIVAEMMKRGVRDYVIKDSQFFDVLIGSVERVLNEIDMENKLYDAQKALKDSEELLALSQKLAKVGSWLYYPLMQKTVWTKEMFNIYGFCPDEGVPDFNKLSSMVHSEDLHFWEKMIENVTNDGQFRELEFRIVRSDGECCWIFAQEGVDREQDGSIFRFYGMIMDITERKQNEEKVRIAQQQLAEANDQLRKANVRLQELALIDSHTGIYNHLYLVKAIDLEFNRAKRFNTALSVLMMDIDYFKSINDVYGHLFGDLILKQLANLLSNVVRQYDVVARFGGEEFIVLLPQTDKQNALILAERILDKVRLYTFGDNKQDVKVKISMGLANYPQDSVINAMDLIEHSDIALTRAKEAGGNRICILDESHKNLEEDNLDRFTTVELLKEKINKLTKRTNQSVIESVFAFAKAISLKDHYTGEHVEKTVKYAEAIGRELGLSKDDLERINQASMLHDLGKIGIPEQILHKNSALSEEEYNQIKRHPQIGIEILSNIQYFHGVIPFILYHHERWDGKGYPTGLKGEEIPMGARVVAIADVFEALTSDRPYRKAYSSQKAVELICQDSGTKFDPHAVNAFVKVFGENAEVSISSN